MQQFSLKPSISEKISKIIFIVLLFLVPIFFLPITSEFYSFNKLALITIATIVLLIIWGVKTIKGEKLEIIKSPIDKSLMALLLVLILSTIFSVSKTDSIFGQQGRWLGLGAFTIMLIYFYLSTPSLKDQKTIKASMYLLLISSTISSLISTLSYYKIFLSSSPFYRFQNFSLTGSIKDAVLLAAIATIISIAMSMYEKSKLSKTALFAITVINFFFISITGTFLGWTLLIAGLAILLFFTKPAILSKNKVSFLIQTLGVAIPILALVFIPATRKLLIDENYIGEMTLPVKESWAIATSTIRDYPLLATGPGTFHLNFSRFKPLSFNNTIYWATTFDKPFNELFNCLSTIGLIGTAVAVIFCIKVLTFTRNSKNTEDETGFVSISSILLTLIIVSFALNHATILSTFLMFSSLSLLIGSHLVSSSTNSKLVKPVLLEVTGLSSISPTEDQAFVSGSYTKYLLAIPAFLIAGYLGYVSFRTYAGEYYMRKSLNAISSNDLVKSYNYQISALKYNPNRDTYYDAFSKINMTIAVALAAKDPAQITDKDRQDIQTFISQALQNSKIATEQVGSLNVANWVTRAQLYQNLINVAQNAFEWSVSAYNTAIQLDPANPQLRLNLGGVYFTAGDYLSAANQFRQAIALKQDYANARYNFALALAAMGDLEQAKSQLEITKLLLPENSEDRKLVDGEIQKISSSIKTAEEQSKKPTVEELTGVTKQQQEQQQPLTDVTKNEAEIGPEVLPQNQEQPTTETQDTTKNR
ncbi:MAG TPA: tetratricopeptide repeat protein [bacterium]|nr:tetratricopeptide repeat protein [bacterium]